MSGLGQARFSRTVPPRAFAPFPLLDSAIPRFYLLLASSCFAPFYSFYFALFELRGASCSHRIDLSLLPQREPQGGAASSRSPANRIEPFSSERTIDSAGNCLRMSNSEARVEASSWHRTQCCRKISALPRSNPHKFLARNHHNDLPPPGTMQCKCALCPSVRPQVSSTARKAKSGWTAAQGADSDPSHNRTASSVGLGLSGTDAWLT